MEWAGRKEEAGKVARPLSQRRPAEQQLREPLPSPLQARAAPPVLPQACSPKTPRDHPLPPPPPPGRRRFDFLGAGSPVSLVQITDSTPVYLHWANKAAARVEL